MAGASSSFSNQESEPSTASNPRKESRDFLGVEPSGRFAADPNGVEPFCSSKPNQRVEDEVMEKCTEEWNALKGKFILVTYDFGDETVVPGSEIFSMVGTPDQILDEVFRKHTIYVTRDEMIETLLCDDLWFIGEGHGFYMIPWRVNRPISHECITHEKIPGTLIYPRGLRGQYIIFRVMDDSLSYFYEFNDQNEAKTCYDRLCQHDWLYDRIRFYHIDENDVIHEIAYHQHKYTNK